MMPVRVSPRHIPRRGHLPKQMDLNLVCYVENEDGNFTGYRTHDLHDVPSVITLEADGQPVGYYKECSRCGWTPTPGAY